LPNIVVNIFHRPAVHVLLYVDQGKVITKKENTKKGYHAQEKCHAML
jgi:hypothetical protein